MKLLFGVIAGGTIVLVWQHTWRRTMWWLFSLGDA
jgi:hypothetical protein